MEKNKEIEKLILEVTELEKKIVDLQIPHDMHETHEMIESMVAFNKALHECVLAGNSKLSQTMMEYEAVIDEIEYNNQKQ